MSAFRFVHAADLHLGSPFSGLEGAPAPLRERLADVSYRALERIVDLCIAEEADFLVLAGDVYDVADGGLRAQARLKEQLARLAGAGIPAYVAHGNHDHCGGVRADLDWPAGVHFFPPGEVASFAVRRHGRDLARLYGVSYPEAAVHENYAKLIRHDGGMYGVAVLHANVGADPSHDNYAPCSLEDLIETRCDYVALGHIHTRRIVHEGQPWAIYPGNPQGRNPRETGPRGCYVVDVDENRRSTPRFVATDVARWQHVEISIEGLASEQELIDALDRTLAELLVDADGRDVVTRVTLTGRGPLHGWLQREGNVADLLEVVRDSFGQAVSAGDSPMCWVESIRRRTRPDLDEARLREGDSLIGDFLRFIEAAASALDTGRSTIEGGSVAATDSDDERLRSIEACLAPLFAHHRASRYLTLPTGDELADLLEEARQLGIDLLVQEEGE